MHLILQMAIITIMELTAVIMEKTMIWTVTGSKLVPITIQHQDVKVAPFQGDNEQSCVCVWGVLKLSFSYPNMIKVFFL